MARNNHIRVIKRQVRIANELHRIMGTFWGATKTPYILTYKTHNTGDGFVRHYVADLGNNIIAGSPKQVCAEILAYNRGLRTVYDSIDTHGFMKMPEIDWEAVNKGS